MTSSIVADAPPDAGCARRGRLDAALGAPIVIGFLLRLAWATAYTRPPFHALSDSASYLRIAEQLASLQTPSLGGVPTAFYPTGYPAALVPVVWLHRATGWLSIEFGASLVNVIAGTVTIWLVGVLAAQWFDRMTRIVAMWTMAIAVAHIIYTPVVMTEMLFTTMAVACVVAITSAIRLARARWFQWVLIGALIGASYLVRNPAFVVAAMPAILVRTSSGSWRGAARVTALVAVGAAVVLMPSLVRNVVQVGVWTPGSTNVAHLLCLGHRDAANGRFQKDLSETIDCTTDSPFDNEALAPFYGDENPSGFVADEPDEAAWYRRQFPKALRWALTHPKRELDLAGFKVGELLNGELNGGAMDAAQGFGTRQYVPERLDRAGRLSANAWHWLVLALAAMAVALLPRARAAWPLWAIPTIFVLTSIFGPETDARYFYPSQPFIVVLAAATIEAAWRGRSGRLTSDTMHPDRAAAGDRVA